MKKIFMNPVNKQWQKSIALTLLFVFLQSIVLPTVTWALTSGPSQPEVSSFTPIGIDNMVDPFSGDFSYNIPLLEVGGYPLSLAYNSGASTDQEASWVGLGWTLNPGAINRQVSALPDEFKDEQVTKEMNIKDNNTYGVNFGGGLEFIGLDQVEVSAGVGLSYNNYTGVGFEMSIEPSLSAAKGSKTQLTGSLGLSASSDGGVSVTPSIGFTDKANRAMLQESSISGGFNSRAGVTHLAFKAPNAPFNGYTAKIGAPTYTPQIGMSMMNASVSIQLTAGAEVFGGHPKVEINGYYSGQYLLNKEIVLPAYGYQYLEEGQSLDKVMLDFNREKDGGFSKNTPNLPLTNLTYDQFSVAGQGVAGSYRLYRSDVGVVFDSEVQNYSGGINLGGIEIGVGNTAHGGLNLALNSVIAKSGKWEEDNDAKNKLAFAGPEPSTPSFETAFFRKSDELAVFNEEDHVAAIGGSDAMAVAVNRNLKSVPTIEKFRKYSDVLNYTTQGMASELVTYSRKPRIQLMSSLNSVQASNFALEKQIEEFDNPASGTLNVFTLNSSGANVGEYAVNNSVNRTNHPDHHFSEFTITASDGTMYVYGIPVYNTSKVEVSFAIDPASPDCKEGLISYSPTGDASVKNKEGLDNFFDKVVTPEYAYAYLLTAVVSHDYVDRTGNGPTDDDLGSYTKFNYRKAVEGYKWRVPIQSNKANHNEGLKSLPAGGLANGDDRASYSYGTKDIYLLHSIETKSHVAEFYVLDREDALGVLGEHGGKDVISTKRQKKLDRIELYSKYDKLQNGSNAEPIKTVWFEYDYSLCQDVPNHVTANEGKLTLKKVYFTYGNSYRAKLNAYTFDYGQVRQTQSGSSVPFNPDYNLKAYDRWGNYKYNQIGSCNYLTEPLSNADFPYVDQNILVNNAVGTLYNPFLIDVNSDGKDDDGRTIPDINAYAWNLTTIGLPSGGEIRVHYEADDYAYVQDKRAMQMLKLLGCNDSPSMVGLNSNLYGSGSNPSALRDYIAVQLDAPIGGSLAEAEGYFLNNYLRDYEGQIIDYMYFKCLVNVSPAGSASDYEFVPGYTEFKLDAITGLPVFSLHNSGSGYDVAFLQLAAEPLRDIDFGGDDVNPIAHAAWNFTKLYLPQIAYGQPGPNASGAVAIVKAMVSTLEQIKSTFTGFYAGMRSASKSKEFEPDKSWVRLYNHNGKKQGGGARVFKVEISDEWNAIAGTGYNDVVYGKVYDYTLTQNGKVISSGVAAYEPMLGGEENPFREPVFVNKKNLLIPDDVSYLEKPFGESFFPGPSVGYSQVTVRDILHEDINRHGTGKEVHQFYTAKDFPTKVRQSQIDPVRKKPNPVFRILKLKSEDLMTVTQGYVIETNDMHGKQKATYTYEHGRDMPYAGTEYFYNKDASGNLDNHMLMMHADGTISEEEIGVTYDMVADMREHTTKSTSSTNKGNLETFLVAMLPIIAPMVVPSFSREKTRFRSAVTTKVIHRTGLLESVRTHSRGSYVDALNLMRDATTGEVVLTESVNKFEDPVFSFNMPAHHAYAQMGMAYENQMMLIPQNFAISNPQNYFTDGDEVAVGNVRAWVVKSGNTYQLMDINGFPVAISGDVLILRSGQRNRLAMEGATIVTKTNPIQGSNLVFQNVINASAKEYRDNWRILCDCGPSPGSKYNPYVHGLKGNWSLWKDWLPLAQRTQTISAAHNNTNIREDGLLNQFSPFWSPSTPTWEKDDLNWTFVDEATYITQYNSELERKDAIGNHSANVFGYKQKLVTAMAKNSQYRELAFDGFEDYDSDECLDNHFSYKTAIPVSTGAQLSGSQSHSGKFSLQLAPNSSIYITKIIEECD